MKLCVIGLGKMGKTLIDGMLDAGLFGVEEIIGCDITAENSDTNPVFSGIATSDNNIFGVEDADTVILAVKPQIIDKILYEIKDVAEGKLIISIAAGVNINRIEEILPDSSRVMRVMPNTPALVREGMSAVVAGENSTKEDIDFVLKIFNSVGEVIELEESLIDGVTGLSGSGPAYIYIIIEALADGGVKTGLPRDIAQKLAAQTVLGAAKMVLETGKHPGELKDMVTSPAGTTIQGVETLEQSGLRGILMTAVKEAAARSKELSQL